MQVANAEIEKDGAQRVVHVPGPAQTDQTQASSRPPRRHFFGPLPDRRRLASGGSLLRGQGLAPIERQPHLADHPATAAAAGPRLRPAAAPAGAVAAVVPPRLRRGSADQQRQLPVTNRQLGHPVLHTQQALRW